MPAFLSDSIVRGLSGDFQKTPLSQTPAVGASLPLPSVSTKVRLLNRLPTLDLWGGDYSSCPEADPLRGRQDSLEAIRGSAGVVSPRPRTDREAGSSGDRNRPAW